MEFLFYCFVHYLDFESVLIVVIGWKKNVLKIFDMIYHSISGNIVLRCKARIFFFSCSELYSSLIEANRIDDSAKRLFKIKCLIHHLPMHNFETLHFLACHLSKVASVGDINMVCSSFENFHLWNFTTHLFMLLSFCCLGR